MKLDSVEIRHVRHLRALTLDVSAPFTVIAGANGAGKTTVQQAVLAALFYTKKEVRDSFVSRFDPDSPPTVVLGFDQAGITVELTRTLTDDKGEWREGATCLKKKKEALDKIQRLLPISADAAALLLWGRQEDMTAVLENFPADGHALLTSATVKGSGPDPKAVIAELAREMEKAKKGERGGQEVGALTEARKKLAALQQELEVAKADDDARQQLREHYELAKNQRDQVQRRFDAVNEQVDKLARVEKLLEQALDDASLLSKLEVRQEGWDGLDGEIDEARKDLADLQQALEQLESEYRVARDRELADRIRERRQDLEALEDLERKCAALQADLESKKRPDATDRERFEELRRRIQTARDKMEASGVHYEVSVTSGTRSVRIAEDGGPDKEIALVSGRPQRGIVGQAVLEADGLRLSLRGKEDISRHRETAEGKSTEMQGLLKRFDAADEAAFLALAKERDDLAGELAKERNTLKIKLAKSSLPALRAEVQTLEQAQTENHLTLKDRERCAGRILPPAAEINNQLSVWRDGKIPQAKDALRAAQAKHPTEAEKALHQKNLVEFRKKAGMSASLFKDADELRREPGKQVREQIKASLQQKRKDQADMVHALTEAREKASGLGGELKHLNPHRPLAVIESERQEADAALHREEVLQEARGLLVQRIGQKADEMAAAVPVELGHRVTAQLSRLTRGGLGRVQLEKDLRLAHVSENGARAQDWQTGQLSHGQRHQAALAVKVAVARTLAESHGPVFIMLDDSLVTFDPDRRACTEDLLLSLVEDRKLQVILFTCHTDWASAWQRRRPEAINYIDLARAADYYGDRAAGVAPAQVSSGGYLYEPGQ